LTPTQIIDRRALITGRVLTADRIIAPPDGEIASILVQARAEHLGEVEAAILALPGCEVHGRDISGKLVVVVEASDASALGTILTTMSQLTHVHTASLVFHAIDVG
jgi:nitrate reductase NapD